MFDIGFAELLIIAVIALLVIGPERLPGAIRTGSAWLNRFRRGFNDLKNEVQQELHNDEVMQELRKTSEQVRKEADHWRDTFSDDSNSQRERAADRDSQGEADTATAAEEKPRDDSDKP